MKLSKRNHFFVFSFGLRDFLSEFGFGLCQVLFVCSHFCLCFKYFFLCLIFLSVKKLFLGLGFSWREERHKYSNMSEDKSNLKCKNRCECVHTALQKHKLRNTCCMVCRPIDAIKRESTCIGMVSFKAINGTTRYQSNL